MSTSLEQAKKILQWAEKVNSNGKSTFRFDTKFVNSVLENHTKYGKFTPRQEQAIKNIYTKFEVEEYLKR